MIVAYIVEEGGDIIMDLEQMGEHEIPGIYLTTILHAISNDHAPETKKVLG